MYKVKFTILQQEILRFLFANAEKSFNERRLAKKLKVSPTGISKSLQKLEREGLIKVSKDRISKRLSIQFNRDNPKAVDQKRVENLKLVYESGLADFLEESFPGCAVVLFGSYSRGEDTTTSDIDIAVVGMKEKEVDASMFEKLLERKVNINFYHSFKKIHKHLLNNILSGILLSGAVDI